MKILSTLMLCICSTGLFAQNGFFLQPEIGTGAGNSRLISRWPSPGNHGIAEYTIFSYQATLELGYRTRKWEFVTGLGYFRTGYDGPFTGGTICETNVPGQGLIGSTREYPPLGSSVTYNPHIILPIKAGYQLLLNKRLALTPYLGAEFAYNMPRVYKSFGQQSMQDFKSSCQQYGVFGLAQLNFEYKITNRIEFTTGLSFHYELTSLVREHDNMPGQKEFDYSMLANLGLRYNFKHKEQAANLK